MDLIDVFLTAFVALFVVVDPFGTASVFTVLTSKTDERTSRVLAFKAAIIAITILIAFGFVGFWLLTKLSISIGAFRIAGGLLLFVTAFRMIMGYHDPDQIDSEAGVYKDQSSLAVFPLAIPMLAGPGCMTAVVLLMTEQSNIDAKTMIVGAIIAVELLALMAMLGARKLTKILGPMGNSILARIMGVLLAAMSVQFVADGVLELFSPSIF